MRLIARKGKFVCALLTVILSGNLFTRVVFAGNEPKTVPVGDEQPKKLREAALKLGFVTQQQFDSWVHPKEMMHPLRGRL